MWNNVASAAAVVNDRLISRESVANVTENIERVTRGRERKKERQRERKRLKFWSIFCLILNWGRASLCWQEESSGGNEKQERSSWSQHPTRQEEKNFVTEQKPCFIFPNPVFFPLFCYSRSHHRPASLSANHEPAGLLGGGGLGGILWRPVRFQG